MTTLGLVVMSCRAAFYNPVIRGRRTKRRDKEFVDYKHYMSKFYDTTNWELHWIPDVTDEKKELSDEETGSTMGGMSPTGSEEEDGRSSPGLVPAIVTSEDGSSFLNLAIPVKDQDEEDEEKDEMEDDDSDYDSTYSYGSDEDLRTNLSMSSASVFSMIFQRKRQLERDRLQQQDMHLSSYSSSSSILSRFMPRRTPRSSRSRASISVPPSVSSPSDAPRTKVQKSYLDTGFVHEESDDDDSGDSEAGVLYSPPPIAVQSSRLRRARPLSRRFRVSDQDPEGFEMEPLTPSPQGRSRRRGRRSPIEELKEIT